MQQAIRDREIIAQRDRRRSARRGAPSPQDIADEIWDQRDLDLLQFPEDFVIRPNEGEIFDLPSGGVEVGEAMIEADGMLRAGTIRVGGQDGDVLDVGSVSRSRFLEALSLCHRAGQVRIPPDEVCEEALSSFNQYRSELLDRCSEIVRQRTTDQRRQRAIVAALMRRALQWRRP